MLKTTLLLGCMLGASVAMSVAMSVAYAANPAAGKQKYEATCAACHGLKGISIATIYPNLAGQKQEYIVSQLKAFRDGTRKNAIMEPMAKGLTDTDIANIAVYVSGLKP